jgi:short subunit dehydrogenase-like uncharacterized protein
MEQARLQPANGAGSVAVFGASGHTGRFVVEELWRRGFAPLAVGRDHARLLKSGFDASAVPVRTASVDDPGSLDRALIDTVAVVNCAGPFLETANAVGAAAVRTGTHYLDVTAEQASAQATFETLDVAARAAHVTVVPAMGFFGGLGDLLATAAVGDWDPVDEIRIGIALDSWHPTAGTRATGSRNKAPRRAIVDGQPTVLPQPLPETSWEFSDPFGHQRVTEMPFSEIVLITRHIQTPNLHTYMNHAPLRDLRDPTTPSPTAADETGRSAQVFLVEALARSGSRIRRARAYGRDIYNFTAPLVGEAVQRIVDNGTRRSGVFAPGELFNALDFLRALEPDNMTLEINER